MGNINSLKFIEEVIDGSGSGIFLVGEDIYIKNRDSELQSISKYSTSGLYLSSAIEQLERRGYNIPIVPTVNSNGICYRKGQILDTEDLIMKNEQNLIQYGSTNSDLKNKIDEKSGSMVDYVSSKFDLSLQKDILTLDLVNEFEYRNTIDLSNLGSELKSEKNSMSLIELGVEITIGEKYYNETTTFEAFQFIDKRGTIIFAWNNFISDRDLYTIEFIDGIVRVIPLSDAVDECIINHCVLVYGRNKN